ncbi:uncharacterized protein BO97DRAFT_395334 [Aspergillus homomorphus CBS 101889]|uniref:Uncharacterized protein n=1 Tax=Aspergillus homomorphus (strain CBS 101889) TaxID=1450537 RepID=A0A395HQH7_ASPHC|nr:hypothetical protein BO97DRAFT_395334 [Aspergillus homomorphus CBS 101889]RAL10000.1 hypothetical protein BO97DRAFT_395334 [Aspergillus homomorphus CBS 101889]
MSDLYCPLPPGDQDIFRFRSRYGVNLGSTFLHGPSSTNAISSNCTEQDELEALKSSIETNGLEPTSSIWGSHWLGALKNDDLLWLRDSAHCNTIQLSLGFLTLGPLFSEGTPFEGLPSQVYTRCWNAIKHLMERCHTHGIGVLLTFDPTANGVDLCSSVKTLALARDCVAFIAQEVTFHALHGVAGLRIALPEKNNEADASRLRDWCREVRMIVSAIDEFLPLYISAGLEGTAKFHDDCATPFPQLGADLGRSGATTIFAPPSHLLLSRDLVQAQAQQARIERPQLLREALSQVEAQEKSCQSAAGRQSFVHGWDLGFSDALRFYDAAVEGLLPLRRPGGADRIGEVELWARRRARDVARLEGDHQTWELGLRRGIADFDRFVGI